MIRLVALLGSAALAVAVVALRCRLGIHRPARWADVTTDPDFPTRIRVCSGCGTQVWDRAALRDLRALEAAR
jgi:hypothetical protein